MNQRWITYRSQVDGLEDRFLIVEPDRAEANRPIAFYLHGHGGLADQVFTHPCLVGLPEKLTQAGITLVAPNLRGNAWMSWAAEQDLLLVIDLVRNQMKPRWMALTGASMGGTSTLIFESLHPVAFDAYLAFCGATEMAQYHRFCRSRDNETLQGIASALDCSYGGTPEDVPEVYRDRSALYRARNFIRPTVFIHGALDQTIPVENGRAMGREINHLPHVRYIEAPNGDHGSIITPDIFLEHLVPWLRAHG